MSDPKPAVPNMVALIQALRQRTGGGSLKACKDALDETKGDLEAAVVVMRERGQVRAAKRAEQVTSEGVVSVAVDPGGRQACMVEVNCETDFVARGDDFRDFVDLLAQRGLQAQADSAQALLKTAVEPGGSLTFEEQRIEWIDRSGENIQLRRVAFLGVEEGVVGAYCHARRIGALVALDQNWPELAKELAMHTVATSPLAVDVSQVPAAALNKEREIFIAEAKERNKPDHIVEKIVSQRMTAFQNSVSLMNQVFFKDPDCTIRDLLASKENTHIVDFVRFELGEGIEKKQLDFAEEVRAQVERSRH